MDRAWAVPAAAGLLAVENIALLGALLAGGNAPGGLEVGLFVKFPLCVGLLQRRPGAFLTLVMWEAMLVVLALLSQTLSLAARVLVLSGGVAGLALLALALSSFPVRMPERP